MRDLPGSVLFCCDHNAVRSPMAEGIAKHLYGTRAYFQSAGVKHDMEVDGFAIAVCRELGVDLSGHKSRSFDEMADWGDDFASYDLVIALSPAAQRRAIEHTRDHAVELEYWPTLDPTVARGAREEKLAAYRKTRDMLAARIRAEFGS